MNQIIAIYCWDLMQGLNNRFLQFFAAACLIGGAALLAASPSHTTLPLIFIQALLFFGSLFAFLVGWASGQQTRAQGPFFFALPATSCQLLSGKFLGTGTWCALFLLLFIGPAGVRAGIAENVLLLGYLSLAFILVCLLAGLVIGLITLPTSGLMTVLMAWITTVAGWELGLLVLSQAEWMHQTPGTFVALLLFNPAGAFRIAAMIGLESIPFDAAELDTGQWVFQNIVLVATGIYSAWIFILYSFGAWMLGRQQY